MNKRILTLFIIPLLFFSSASATVWTVDNNANATSQFTDIQPAIDSANAGDTIMVEGSNTTYSSFIVPKPLTLIGEGYIDAHGLTAKINSNIGIASSYVRVMGFEILNNGKLFLRDADTIQDVVVSHCLLLGIELRGRDTGPQALFANIIFRNNVIKGGIALGKIDGVNAYRFERIHLDTLLVENCILQGGITLVKNAYAAGNVSGLTSFALRNNVLNQASSCNCPFFFPNPTLGARVKNIVISNNIFYEVDPRECSNCTFTHNCFWDPANGRDSLPDAPSGNNNLLRTDPLFVNYNGGSFVASHDFHLAPGSPCLTGGIGGTQIGIYGGTYPFNVGDGPSIPIVDFLELLNSAVPPNSPIVIDLTARARN